MKPDAPVGRTRLEGDSQMNIYLRVNAASSSFLTN